MEKNIESVLTAAADALMIPLTMNPDSPYAVFGEGIRKLPWFGGALEIEPQVMESLVDIDREIVVMVIKFVGSLHGLLISDGQQGKLQVFILDGSKLGLTGGKAAYILPHFWRRETVYKAVLKGIKASFHKKFYGTAWEPMGEGTQWIEHYLEKKASTRAANARA